jgi:hypothetical protein
LAPELTGDLSFKHLKSCDGDVCALLCMVHGSAWQLTVVFVRLSLEIIFSMSSLYIFLLLPLLRSSSLLLIRRSTQRWLPTLSSLLLVVGGRWCCTWGSRFRVLSFTFFFIFGSEPSHLCSMDRYVILLSVEGRGVSVWPTSLSNR